MTRAEGTVRQMRGHLLKLSFPNANAIGALDLEFVDQLECEEVLFDLVSAHWLAANWALSRGLCLVIHPLREALSTEGVLARTLNWIVEDFLTY